jgi:hypothetical protein
MNTARTYVKTTRGHTAKRNKVLTQRSKVLTQPNKVFTHRNK